MCHTIRIAVLVLAVAISAPAGAIRGRVTDPAGRAVPFARVEIVPGDQVLTTDGGGEFATPDLPEGDYKLTVIADGFEPVVADRVTVRTGETASVDVAFRKLRTAYTQISVIGEEPEIALRKIPGSVSLIGTRELAATHPVDANESLRRLPGVHVREDSGPVGMRMNIGIRGLNPDRSRALLVLEDGLPLALAPYGEPEMYYSPPIDRMSRVEVVKGSGSIVYGPQTIGGVLNFVTPDPPPRQQGTLELAGGQRGFFTGQASYGGTHGRAGWFVNMLRKQGDGWRDFWFDINDVMAKFQFAATDRHRLGWKFGIYDESSNSTYLGLTERQFRADPDFNAVPDDLLRIRRYSGSMMHTFVLSPRTVLTTTAFGYTTVRNWRRQDFDRAPKPGTAYLRVIDDELFLRNSTGNNNREFDVAGAESRLGMDLGRQKLDAGVRYMHEEHRDRRVDGNTNTASTGITREYEVRYGDAWSAFVQDRVTFGRFTLSPGLRLERYAYIRDIRRQPVGGVPTDVNVRRADSVFKPIPGAGLAYRATDSVTLFTGVHRGFAPPRVKDAITRAGVSLELDAEMSWNYEAGVRMALARGLRFETTLFATDFSNQIIPAAVSGGAATTLMNAGRTLHRGAEMAVAFDWSRLARAGITSDVRWTWLPDARFESGEFNGNRLPYAPRHTLVLEMGYRHRSGLSLHVDGTRAGAQFADNRQTRPASSDGTIGLIPSYWVWNVSAGREFTRERFSFSPYVTVKNVADAVYVSSRAPLGIQPGMFRQVNAGIKVRF